jgi:hypothetical protein
MCPTYQEYRMTAFLRTAFVAAATVLTLAASGAQAGGIDPNTFIVGHPASPRWTAAPHQHAGQDHPAVQVARQGVRVDPNAYRVQPPASTHWTVAPESVRFAEASMR